MQTQDNYNRVTACNGQSLVSSAKQCEQPRNTYTSPLHISTTHSNILEAIHTETPPHLVLYHIPLYHNNNPRGKCSYRVISVTAMSGSSPSTIHSMKMEPAVSPKLHWLSLGSVHCTRLRNTPERIDAILRRVHTEVHYADSGCGVESGIERNHTPRRRDSLAFTVIPKLPLRSSTTNPTLYQCYHPRVSTTFSAVSANHFSFLTGWL